MDSIEDCLINQENWLDISASKELDESCQTVPKEISIPCELVTNKENSIRRMMFEGLLKENMMESPLTKYEELKAWRPMGLKEPLGISQRLNISG